MVFGMKKFLSPEDGGAPSMSGFEDDEPSKLEIIELQPGEEPPKEEEPEKEEKITMSKAEFEALKESSNSTNVISQGLRDLASTLKPSGHTVNTLQQAPGETDEDFEKRLEQDLFAQGKTGKVLKEAIGRESGKLFGAVVNMLAEQNKELLKLKPDTAPIFSKYGKEIEEYVSSLPASQRNLPQVWDRAVKEVKNRHQDEINQEEISSKVDALVAKKVAEKLKELGLDAEEVTDNSSSSSPRPRANPLAGSNGGRTANVGSGQKTKLYYTQEDVEKAARMCVPLEEYLVRKPKAK